MEAMQRVEEGAQEEAMEGEDEFFGPCPIEKLQVRDA